MLLASGPWDALRDGSAVLGVLELPDTTFGAAALPYACSDISSFVNSGEVPVALTYHLRDRL